AQCLNRSLLLNQTSPLTQADSARANSCVGSIPSTAKRKIGECGSNCILMCGVKTNIVTSVQVSDGYAHDYPYFKPLVERTAKTGFSMKEVSADKGYLGATNMLATLQKGAIPYIPFKSNSVPDSRGSYGPKSELWTRMYHFYSLHRAEFLEHYHKRSNVETTLHMIKSKFGQRLRSRTLTAQINEALCR